MSCNISDIHIVNASTIEKKVIKILNKTIVFVLFDNKCQKKQGHIPRGECETSILLYGCRI